MKSLFISILCLALFVPLFAQKGKVIESLTFNSKIVSYPVKYSVYLPADYESSQRNYPVLYLLHGDTPMTKPDGFSSGEANNIADKGIAEGAFPSCIIIIPDGKVTWYSNSADGKDRWEDMFISELIPFVEKEYHIRAKKSSGRLQDFRWEDMERLHSRCAIRIYSLPVLL